MKKRNINVRVTWLNDARLEKQLGTTSTLPQEPSAGDSSVQTELEDVPGHCDSSGSEVDIVEESTKGKAQETFDDLVTALICASNYNCKFLEMMKYCLARPAISLMGSSGRDQD